MMTEPHIFEPLPLRRREVVAISQDEYSIMSQSGEVKEVKANTAYEAFKMSGFSEAIRIERKALAKTPVVTQSHFIADVAGAVGASADANTPFTYRQQRPVVSADDLDALMRMLQAAQAESAKLPEQQDEVPQVITSPTGMEVHGDGFDEIIPATVSPSQMTGIKSSVDTVVLAEDLPQQPAAAAPQAAAPAAPPQATPQAAAPQVTAEALPDKELTQDEITKLLNG